MKKEVKLCNVKQKSKVRMVFSWIVRYDFTLVASFEISEYARSGPILEGDHARI